MAKFDYKKWVTENKHGKLSEYRDENPFDNFDKEFEDLKAKEPKKRIPNPPKIVGDKEIKMSGTRINPEWSEWNESVKPYRDLYQKLLNYELQNKDKIKYTTQKTK